jgi:hypothetical protein
VSHHFDSAADRADGRINLCDLYVFPGAPGTTALILTVNPDAGRSSHTTFRPDAVYEFVLASEAGTVEDLDHLVATPGPVTWTSRPGPSGWVASIRDGGGADADPATVRFVRTRAFPGCQLHEAAFTTRYREYWRTDGRFPWLRPAERRRLPGMRAARRPREMGRHHRATLDTCQDGAIESPA